MQKYSTFGNSGSVVLVAQKSHCSFQHKLFLFFPLFALWLLNSARKRYNREWQVKKLLVWDDYNIWWQYLANRETKKSPFHARKTYCSVNKNNVDINRIQSNFGGQTQRQISSFQTCPWIRKMSNLVHNHRTV